MLGSEDLPLAPGDLPAVVGMHEVERRFEITVFLRADAQDAPDLGRTMHAVTDGVVLVSAELRDVGRGAEQLFAVAQGGAAVLELLRGLAQRPVDRVHFDDARVAQLDRIAAADGGRRARRRLERSREVHAEHIGGNGGQQSHQHRRRSPHPQQLAGLGIDQPRGKGDAHRPAGQ